MTINRHSLTIITAHRLRIKIRPEKITDYDRIYQLIDIAFQSANTPPAGEANYAVLLRQGPNYLPTLALVATWGQEIVGHVMLTKTHIQRGNQRFVALLLAPLSVQLEYRQRGVGTRLMKAALKRAKELGYGAVFLCGDPQFYGRFGFCPVGDFGFTYALDIPPQYVLVCELQVGWLKNKTGEISLM